MTRLNSQQDGFDASGIEYRVYGVMNTGMNGYDSCNNTGRHREGNTSCGETKYIRSIIDSLGDGNPMPNICRLVGLYSILVLMGPSPAIKRLSSNMSTRNEQQLSSRAQSATRSFAFYTRRKLNLDWLITQVPTLAPGMSVQLLPMQQQSHAVAAAAAASCTRNDPAGHLGNIDTSSFVVGSR